MNPTLLVHEVPVESVADRGVTELAIGILGERGVHQREGTLDGVKRALI